MLETEMNVQTSQFHIDVRFSLCVFSTNEAMILYSPLALFR